MSRVGVTSTDYEDKILTGKLDYVLANVSGDERPYLGVKVFGVDFLGLLDSGASRTVLGGVGCQLFKQFNLQLFPSEIESCKVANGAQCPVLGCYSVPFCVEDRVSLVDVLVMPSLPHTLILGSDFWCRLGIVPDLRHGHWQFSESADPQVCSLTDSSHLTPEEAERLEGHLQELFIEMPTGLGCTTLVEHKIRTSAEPIKQRFYPISPALQKQVFKELDDMLAQGVVEPSNSPWASPIVMVKKSDGSYRFCVDYRKLNKVTERDAYPLPLVTNTLDKLRDAKYLTSLDIKSAYWQVPVSKESIPLTAFTVPGRGLFQFRRMPFGLHNAPATWQRLIDRVLSPLEQYVFVYLDDIVIVTQTFEQHLDILRKVFDRLTSAGLTLRRDKCHFCRTELKFLGYVVDGKGLRCDPDKVSAILNIPPPSNVTEVRRFLGIASWYRRFVPNFASLMAPITNLLKKKIKFAWSTECKRAFQTVKECLVASPVITCPNFEEPFTIQTDASDYGLGAVLTQDYPDGEKVISFISRSLTSSERKFSTTEKECLAVLWAIEKFRPYIEATHFTVVTDHFALLWLSNLKDPAGRLARWCVRLQQYDFTVIHRRGKDHVVPDALSRGVPVVNEVAGEVPFPNYQDRWYSGMLQKVTEDPLRYPQWRVHNSTLYRHVRSSYPGLRDQAFDWRTVVPKSHRKAIIGEHHDSPVAGHAGAWKTLNRLTQKYYWPKMRADVSRYVRGCTVCLANKSDHRGPAGLMTGRPNITRPWEFVSVDLVGPLPPSTSGFRYILSVQDYFSKFCIFIPLRSATAKMIVQHVEDDVFLVFGVPRVLWSDNGSQFVGREWQDLARKYNVHLSRSANYHPQANPVERPHGFLKTMLSSFVRDNHRAWATLLPKVACAARTAVHESTGATPFFVNFGREMVLDGRDHVPPPVALDEPAANVGSPTPQARAAILREVFLDVRKRLDKAMAKAQQAYNLRRRDVQYNVGERVWRKNFAQSNAGNYFTAKLAPKYIGPFVVRRKVSPWTYELHDLNNTPAGVWNVKDLKPDTSDPNA